MSFQPGLFLQSKIWQQFLKSSNIESYFFYTPKSPIRALIIIKKIAPFLRFGYCPYGPLIIKQDLKDHGLTKKYFLFLKKITLFCKKRKLIFLRFNPPFFKKKSFCFPDLVKSLAKTKEPEKTIYLDLKKTEQELLSQMKAKTRYNIKLSSKKELIIERGINQKNVQAFLTLTQETASRDNFTAHSKNYYQKMIEVLGKEKILSIYSAFYQNKPIASNLIINFENCATYLHGSSSNENRNLMSTYLLQWHAILDAKKTGCKYYDFWGIDEKKWPGVTRFKQGFGGKEVEFHPTYELPINQLGYSIFQNIRKIFKI